MSSGQCTPCMRSRNHVKYSAVYFTLIAVSFWMGEGFAIQVTLQLRDSAAVNNTTIFARDVGEITTEVSDTVKDLLLSVPLGESAPCGHSRYMLKEDIHQCFIYERLRDIRVVVNGKKRIVIKTDGKEKKIADYEADIQAYIRERIKWEDDQYTVDIGNRDVKWYLLDKPSETMIEGAMSPFARGSVPLRLRITQDGRMRQFQVPCRIRVTIPVVCAKEKIVRNEMLSADRFELRVMDITAFTFVPYSTLDSVIGRRAARTMTPGSPVHNRCIKYIPEIYRGDQVFLEYKKDSIIITIPVRAQEDGIVGERIRVENIITKKLIEAVVLQKGLVTL